MKFVSIILYYRNDQICIDDLTKFSFSNLPSSQNNLQAQHSCLACSQLLIQSAQHFIVLTCPKIIIGDQLLMKCYFDHKFG